MTVWQRHQVLMAMITVAMLLGTMAQAAVLTFDGAICHGGNPCNQGAGIDQTYGDIPGQLEVTYTTRSTGGNGPIIANFLAWWDVLHGDLVNVARTAAFIDGVAEIALIPAPGFQVTLNSFDLAAFQNISRTTQYTIYDSTYTPIISSGTITIGGSGHGHFPFPLTHTQGLIIQWGPTANTVGIDNVDFTVEPIVAPRKTTGILLLEHTKIKTVTADTTAPALITLLPCPLQVVVFSPTVLTCPVTAPAVCTIEANLTSEVSDVTPGADSIRFYLTVDGAATGVFPTTNFGAHSTAKSRQIESATASWMRNAVTSGGHTLEVKGCVADTTVGGGAIAFAGDRILTMRLYRGH